MPFSAVASTSPLLCISPASSSLNLFFDLWLRIRVIKLSEQIAWEREMVGEREREWILEGKKRGAWREEREREGGKGEKGGGGVERQKVRET